MLSLEMKRRKLPLIRQKCSGYPLEPQVESYHLRGETLQILFLLKDFGYSWCTEVNTLRAEIELDTLYFTLLKLKSSFHVLWVMRVRHGWLLSGGIQPAIQLISAHWFYFLLWKEIQARKRVPIMLWNQWVKPFWILKADNDCRTTKRALGAPFPLR